ncbi:MAG: glycosyltransferase, partial [Candidatus Saccharimonadales bacterium]
TRSLLTVWPVQRIIVSNEADFSMLPNHLKSKLKIIPISSTLAPAKPDKKRFLQILKMAGLDQSKQIMVFFGLPFANKRLEILVDAATQLSDQVQLLLPIEADNQNDYANTILARAKELKANGAPIGLTGFLSDQDMCVVLAAAVYFVLPQTTPPLTAKSSTAIAAAENGCVIIAAATQPRNFSKPFVSGKNCWLLDDLSPENLAKTINELADNPARRQKLASEAARLAKYFDWENVVKLYSELYKELAN